MPIDPNEVGPGLESLGYEYVSGWGPTAVWRQRWEDENGDAQEALVSEVTLADEVWGNQSPYNQDAAVDQGSSAPKLQYDAQGQAYQWNGYDWEPIEQFNDPTQAAGYQAPPRTSYSVSQSYSDPTALALQRAQLQETIRGNMAQEAADQVKLEFERDRIRILEEQGASKQAHDAAVLAESIQSRIDRNQFDRQKLQQDLTLVDREIAANDAREASRQAFERGESSLDRQFRAGESALTRQFEGQENAADRALTRETAMRADATTRARTAAEFAANGATDFGKLSSFLGNGGLSPYSTAIGQGQSAITDQSLEPLAALLQPYPGATATGPRPIAQATGDTPWSPEYQQEVGNRIRQQFVDAVGSGAMGSTTIAPNAEDEARLSGMGITTLSDYINQFGAGGPAVSASTTDGVTTLQPGSEPIDRAIPRMEDGGAVVNPGVINSLMALVQALGLEPKAVAGERGAASGETVYGEPGASMVVVPDKGQGGQGMPQMEYGGGVISSLLEKARAYQAQAGQTALTRSGMTTAPTPVAFSDPGLDPEMMELGASVAAVTRGVPRKSFLNEALRVRPAGLAMGINRRTY